jgi:S1-C subfamily serine protease
MRRGSLGLWAFLGCLGFILVMGAVVFAGVALLRQLAVLPSASWNENSPDATGVVDPSPTAARENATQPPAHTQSAPTPEVRMVPFNLNSLYQQVNPGVVSIEVLGSTTLGEGGTSSGSGFIIDEDGHIVTNHHVVANSQRVTVVFFNGITAPAEVIGNDPDSDLAVVRVDGLIPEAHPLPLGDSNEVVVGQSVVALGNPFNLSNTMTFGIVSAVGRVIPSGFTRYNIPQAIQTDAAINPGNSGGPLINLEGEVIGVNAQIRTTSAVPGNVGIGFAIPSNIVRLVAPALIEQGAYQWAYLGVTGLPVSPIIAEANNLPPQTRGAYIIEIVPGGPADLGSMQGSQSQQIVDGVPVPVGGDIIIEAAGETVNSFNDLLNVIAFSRPGDEIELVVLRGGEPVPLTVTLQPRPSGPNQPLP